MNLSNYSSEVVGFDSTFDKDKEVMVRDASTDVMESNLKFAETSTSTNEKRDFAVSLYLCAQ